MLNPSLKHRPQMVSDEKKRSGTFEYRALITPLLTGMLGILSGLLLSANNARISENQFFLQKQAQTADLIGKSFPVYIDVYRRIITLGTDAPQSDGRIDEKDLERMNNYIDERQIARDNLYSALDTAHLYFNEEVSKEIYAFRSWDEPFQKAYVRDLPELAEWQRWQISIFNTLRNDMQK